MLSGSILSQVPGVDPGQWPRWSGLRESAGLGAGVGEQGLRGKYRGVEQVSWPRGSLLGTLEVRLGVSSLPGL